MTDIQRCLYILISLMFFLQLNTNIFNGNLSGVMSQAIRTGGGGTIP